MSPHTARRRSQLSLESCVPAVVQHSAMPMAFASLQGLLCWGAALLTFLTCSSSGDPFLRASLGVAAGHSAGGGDETLVLHRILTDMCHQKHQFRPYKD